MPVLTGVVGAPTAGGLPVSQDIVGAFTEVPYAAIIEVTRSTAVSAVQAHAHIARGFTDGVRHRCVAMASRDADTVILGHFAAHIHEKKLLVIGGLGPGYSPEAEADFTAFIPGGVRISWTKLPLAAYRIKVTFIYGEAWQAYVQDYDGNGTVDNSVDITGCPFRPRGALVSGALGSFITGPGPDAVFMAGAVALAEDGTVTGQWGHTHFEANLPVTVTTVGGGIRTDSILARISVDPTTGVLTEECRHEAVAGLPDGIRITTRVGSMPMSGCVMLLRNGDRRFWAAVPAIATTTTGDKTVTIGWQPITIWGVPTGKFAVNAYANSGVSCGAWSMGTNDGQGNQRCACTATEDAVGTSDCYNAVALNFAVLNVTGGSDWVGSITAHLPTGFTFNISNPSSSPAFTGFFAVEKSGPAPEAVLKGRIVAPGLARGRIVEGGL